jgi:NagD protein
MDGVLINDGAMVPGADHFLARLRATARHFLVLTNNSLFTPLEIQRRLASLGLDVGVGQVWTSALATAHFVATQRPGGTAFVIGCDSLHQALADVGYREGATRADYVVVGETWDYSFDDFATAIGLIGSGSHFVATNPEPTGPTRDGSLPGCGAMTALIENATGVSPYVVGKPNALMIHGALNTLDWPSRGAVMIGDRMETDVLVGVNAGLSTILALSGANNAADATRYAFRPSRVVSSIAELIEEL